MIGAVETPRRPHSLCARWGGGDARAGDTAEVKRKRTETPGYRAPRRARHTLTEHMDTDDGEGGRDMDKDVGTRGPGHGRVLMHAILMHAHCLSHTRCRNLRRATPLALDHLA